MQVINSLLFLLLFTGFVGPITAGKDLLAQLHIARNLKWVSLAIRSFSAHLSECGGEPLVEWLGDEVSQSHRPVDEDRNEDAERGERFRDMVHVRLTARLYGTRQRLEAEYGSAKRQLQMTAFRVRHQRRKLSKAMKS